MCNRNSLRPNNRNGWTEYATCISDITSISGSAIKRKRSHLSLTTLPITVGAVEISAIIALLPFFLFLLRWRSCVKTATRKRTLSRRDRSFFFLPSTSDAGTHSFEMVRSRGRGRKKESARVLPVLRNLFITYRSSITNFAILPRYAKPSSTRRLIIS